MCVDYCQSEYMIANCSETSRDAVVLMQTARYGRMKLGACGTGGSTNVVGCSEDVLWYLDRRCSGRRHCKLYVANPVLHHLNPCDSDYSAYLHAKYTCVPGEQMNLAHSQYQLQQYFSMYTQQWNTYSLFPSEI